jgi:ABC-type branched-subunit amino acid transport system permease subunit
VPDDTTPVPGAPVTDPQIGADEWVARSADRTLGRGGLLGQAEQQWLRIPPTVRFLGLVGFAALIPVLTSDDYLIRIGTVTLVFALLALGLNVSVGFAGLLDLGYIAFYGFGAYGYAMLASSKFGVHWQAWAAIPVVVGAGVLLGFLLALPSRRLSGDYLAIVTLFFGQIFYILVTQGYRISLLGLNKDIGLKSANWDVTGGPNGIANVDGFRIGSTSAVTDHAYFYISLVAVALVYAALHFANNSRTGRAWRALNDDALAAQVMSMRINWLKMLAIGVGAGIGALAGTINGALLQGAFPDDYNTFVLITIYAVVILGGAGSLAGGVLGAIIVTVGLEALRPGTEFSDWTSNGRGLFYVTILIVLLVALRPHRRLLVVLGGTLVFGILLHVIVGAAWPRGVHGGILNSANEFSGGGSIGWAIRHWLVLPNGTYQVGQYTVFNYLLVLLIAMILGLTLLKGWMRDALLVPTIWLAAFVYETRLIEEGSGATRFLLLGAGLIVIMAKRPQGLLGKPRVEIV